LARLHKEASFLVPVKTIKLLCRTRIYVWHTTRARAFLGGVGASIIQLLGGIVHRTTKIASADSIKLGGWKGLDRRIEVAAKSNQPRATPDGHVGLAGAAGYQKDYLVSAKRRRNRGKAGAEFEKRGWGITGVKERSWGGCTRYH
jgi:hypothetical protein